MTTIPTQEKTLAPHSEEAEQAVLGSMLIDAAAVDVALEILRPDNFYLEANNTLFALLASMAEARVAIDMTTIEEYALRKRIFEYTSTESRMYLLHLMGVPSTSANAAYYARIVHDKAQLRRLLDVSARIQAMALGEYTDVAEVIDRAEAAVFAVNDARSQGKFTAFASILDTEIDALEERCRNPGAMTGCPTPFSELNYMTGGLQPSDLIIVAARPSMGKTSLSLQLATDVAKRRQGAVAVFSLEMSKEQLGQRLICGEARLDLSQFKSGILTEMDWDHVVTAAEALSDIPLYIDDTPDVSVMEVRAKCRRLMAKEGLALVMIDYLQLMRAGGKKGENRNQEIAEIARGCKNLARELNVPVIALSQVSRACEQRPNKRPGLADLRESGSLEAEADVVLFLYRDAYYKDNKGGEAAPTTGAMETAELIIAKQRNGPTGVAKVGFLPTFARFTDIDRRYAAGPDDYDDE